MKHARQMAAHVFKTENEDIIVQETVDGVGEREENFENGLVEMQLYTRMTEGRCGIFHVAISPREHESLTPEQQARAVDMIEEKFGLTGQLRQRIDHVKDGRFHTHVFWSTVDQEEAKLIPLPLYKRKLQECANDMTQEFDLEPVHRRPNENTIEVTNADRMIEARSKEKGKREKAQDRKEEVTAIWDQTETGEAFLKGLRDAGYDVAKGEKARFILLDREGNTFNLARDLPRLVKVKNLGERFGALEQGLQSVEDAQALRKQRQEYDRTQARIDSENRILDAADKFGQKPEKERAKIQKPITDQKPEIVQNNDPPQSPKDKKPERIESYAEKLDRIQEYERAQDWQMRLLKDKLNAFYKPGDVRAEIKALKKGVEKTNTPLGRMSGRHKDCLQELQDKQREMADIQDRMKNQISALQKKHDLEREGWILDPPANDELPIDPADRKQAALEKHKAKIKAYDEKQRQEREQKQDREGPTYGS